MSKEITEEKYNMVSNIDTKKLEDVRKLLGLINIYLKTGMAQATYYRILERGTARKDTIEAIIKAFNDKLKEVKKLDKLTLDDFLVKPDKKGRPTKEEEDPKEDHYYKN